MAQKTWSREGIALGPEPYERWSGLPGKDVARHRTGRTRRVAAEHSPTGRSLAVKVYAYPTGRDRWRGLGRNTALAPSRVARESRMLEALAKRGLQPELWVAYGEARRTGLLHHSFLVTHWVESRRFDHALIQAVEGESSSAGRAPALDLVEALARFVGRCHGMGYVDRDFHLRNVLVGADGAVIKIDNPRAAFPSRLFHESGCRRDLSDLEHEIVAIAGAEAWAAFRRCYEAARARAD